MCGKPCLSASITNQTHQHFESKGPDTLLKISSCKSQINYKRKMQEYKVFEYI